MTEMILSLIKADKIILILWSKIIELIY